MSGAHPIAYLSLFSGMEAATLAWAPLGWRCAAVAEVDPAACALLAHRFPDVPNLGDVTAITDDQLAALGPVDVVIGGSPCQDLSVAGKRAGLAGARSSLFHHQLRIFRATRTLCGARFLIWENVPGAFSINAGRDFAVVVGSMAGCKLPVPAGGWGSEGVALGDNGLVEWAVLDAQWRGLAQRRKRVFAVLDSGNWAGRPPILLERDSLRGDSPPRRETGQGVAGTIAGGARSRGSYSHDDIPLTAEVAGTLRAPSGCGCAPGPDEAKQGLLIAFGGNNTAGPIDVATARNACGSGSGRLDFESETFLVQETAHTLRADGFDASEDGTGRGTPLVPVLAFDSRQDCVHSESVFGALGGSSPQAQAVAIHENQRGEISTSETAGSLKCGVGKPGQGYPAVAIAWGLSPDTFDRSGEASTGTAADRSGLGVDQEIAYALRTKRPGGVVTAMQVRRLTPLECERLQGAPDGWTAVPNAKGKTMADGPRYKMIGNSFAVPVVRYIGERIQSALSQPPRSNNHERSEAVHL